MDAHGGQWDRLEDLDGTPQPSEITGSMPEIDEDERKRGPSIDLEPSNLPAPYEDKGERNSERLTPRQSRFIEEYLVDLNGRLAAIRAGYPEKSAQEQSSRMLSLDKVRVAVDVGIARRTARVGMTQDRVVDELAKLAFSNMQTYAEWGPRGVSLKESFVLDGVEASCVAEVSQTTTAGGGSLKFKLHDKVAALKLLGQHVGMFRGESDPDMTKGTERVFVVMGGQKVYF